LLERSGIPTWKIEKSTCDQILSALQLGRIVKVHRRSSVVYDYREIATKITIIGFDNDHLWTHASSSPY